MTRPAHAVVDVSVAAKWLFGEPGTAHALAWKKQSLKEGIVLCAPEYLLVELHNIVWKKIQFAEMSATDPILQFSPNFGLDLNWLPTLPLLPSALNRAIALKIAVYDAIYVALSLALGASFCTADQALAHRLKGFSVPVDLI